jgi:hypothetical protein
MSLETVSLPQIMFIYYLKLSYSKNALSCTFLMMRERKKGKENVLSVLQNICREREAKMNEEASSSKRPAKLLKAGRGIYCCIPKCGSAFYNNMNEKTGIGFFKFPSDSKQQQTWKRIIKLCRRKGGNDHFRVDKSTRICEFHFNPKDIKVSIGIGRKI